MKSLNIAKSIAPVLTMGGVPGGKTGDATKADVVAAAKETAPVKMAEQIKKGLNAAKEYRSQLRNQRKGTGAKEGSDFDYQKYGAKESATVLEGATKSNFTRFVKKIPANSKSSATFRQLKDGNYLFEATSPGRVPGSKAVYQKWVNPQGKTFKMLKTTFGPDGKIIHVKPK